MISIRGAITVNENTKEEILENTERMVNTIMIQNEISKEEIVSIMFTCTKDIDAVYPAVAARAIGITEAALMCMSEMYVEGSLKKCIRCAVFCESTKKQSEVIPVYLEKAMRLRPDLIQVDNGGKSL